MAELTVFGYRPGVSLIHELDVRCKIAILILISLVSLQAASRALFALTLLLIGVQRTARLPLRPVFSELRNFSILLLLVFIARALTTPGSVLIEYGFAAVTREGIHDGIVVCWRLLIIVMAGLLFVTTTRPSQLKVAVQWFLSPFPFLPQQRVAVMLGLIMRFLPVIFNQARETVVAQRARGVENRKNPVYRLRKLGIPLIRKTFESADNLAMAMEARCYTDKRTEPTLSMTQKDWIALLGVICISLVLVKI